MFAVGSLLEDLHARGDRPCVIEAGPGGVASHASAEVATRSRALATGLLAAGVGPGARIGLFAPNGAAWITARLAIAAAGGVAVCIDHQANAAEAAGIVEDSRLRFVLAGPAQARVLAVDDVFRELTIRVMDDVRGAGGEAPSSSWRRLMATDPAPRIPPLDADAPAMLVYTSGTTGKPKAFALRNRHLEATVRAIAAFGLVGPDDRLLLPLPLHHVYPFVVGLLVPLAVGAPVVLPEAATGPKILDALVRSEATAMIGVPRLYEALVAGLDSQARARGKLAYPAFRTLLALSIAARRRFGRRLGRHLFPQVHARLGARLRVLVSAGARLDEETLWTLEGLGYVALSGYGLAETSSAFTGNVPGAQRIGSEGRPLLAEGRIRIARPDASGTGEIELSGPNVFDGYIDEPEANARAFTTDGWFRTGDLGRLDADGYLHVSGRSKELIVLGGGKNVFPEDLERTYGADPAIDEIAVLEDAGRLVALVVPDMAAIRASANTRAEDVVRVALAAAGRPLPSHDRLSGFALSRAALPRTRLGKYQRFRLPELYRQASDGGAPAKPAELSAEDEALLREPRAAAAWKILQTRYRTRAPRLDSDLQLDLGIDSLEWLNLGLELESGLGIRLSEQDFASAGQVRDLLRELGASRAGEEAPAEASAVAIEELAARWLAPTPPVDRAAGAALWALARLLGRLIFRLRVTGREHLPASGPYVLVCNHTSDLDPPLLAAALPFAAVRRLYWSGDRGRLFGSRFQRWFARVAHVFPVDEQAAATTLALAERILSRAGGALVWFPEGWRSPDGRLQRFLPGIGRLLADHPVPVVPAAIRGAFEAMPRDRRLPRPWPVAIAFGPPLDPRQLAVTGPGRTPSARITDGLRAAVAALAGEAEAPPPPPAS